MANYITPPAKTEIKVTSKDVRFYKSPSQSGERAYRINPKKENGYVDWQAGDILIATGNVLANSEGNWVEAETPRWYKRNWFSSWVPIPLLVYYRVEDNTATWISSSVVGTQPPQKGSVGTGNSGTGTPAPEPEKQDKTLQNAGIGLVIASFIILTRK